MNKLAVLALVAATSSVAWAQPAPAGPAATAPGAPQTTSWQEVNHINGQLVPVGQENDYLKKYKRWNVSTNPIGWIVGSYGVSLSYGINDNIAVRGDINYFDPPGDDNFEARGVELGVGLPIYFRRTYQGLFLEPGIISRSFTVNDEQYNPDTGTYRTVETSNTTFGPQVLVGWHWTWASGLNFAVAAGAGRNWAAEDTEYGESEVFGNGYMRFGYAF